MKVTKLSENVQKAWVTVELIGGETVTLTRTGKALRNHILDSFWISYGKERLDYALENDLLLLDDGSRVPLCNVKRISPVTIEDYYVQYRLVETGWLFPETHSELIYEGPNKPKDNL